MSEPPQKRRRAAFGHARPAPEHKVVVEAVRIAPVGLERHRDPGVASEAALVAQKRGSIVTPVDVTIDGFRGKQIDLMVPLNVKIAACDGGMHKGWTDTSSGDRYNQGPGQLDLLDILDVNGTTLVIDRVFYPANTSADLAELQAIFDSIKITP